MNNIKNVNYLRFLFNYILSHPNFANSVSNSNDEDPLLFP